MWAPKGTPKGIIANLNTSASLMMRMADDQDAVPEIEDERTLGKRRGSFQIAVSPGTEEFPDEVYLLYQSGAVFHGSLSEEP